MGSDDWGREPPKTVDIAAVLRRNPKHKRCQLTIHRSRKNPLFTGLYCKEHDAYLTWINEFQEQWLIELGVEAHTKEDFLIDVLRGGVLPHQYNSWLKFQLLKDKYKKM